MKKITKFLIGTLAMVAPPAAAQDVVMALDPTLMTGWSGVAGAGEYAKRDFGTRLHRPSARGSALAATPQRVTASLTFRPDPAVRNQVYNRAVAEWSKRDRAEGAKLRQLLQSGKVMRDMNGYMAGYGLNPNNVGDTTAMYLALAWNVVHGSSDDPGRAQVQGLRRQTAATFATLLDFMRAGPATRQELSDANVIQSAFVANIANAMAKDGSLAGRARNSVAQGVKSIYGLDLRTVKLTSAGFQ